MAANSDITNPAKIGGREATFMRDGAQSCDTTDLPPMIIPHRTRTVLSPARSWGRERYARVHGPIDGPVKEGVACFGQVCRTAISCTATTLNTGLCWPARRGQRRTVQKKRSDRKPVYQAKWLKALLASAMRWMFSRTVMAAPWRLKASISSLASFSWVGLPLPARIALMIQRNDRDCWRFLVTGRESWKQRL